MKPEKAGMSHYLAIMKQALYYYLLVTMKKNDNNHTLIENIYII